MASGTTLAIHQPNYIPWPGYFHKLAAADVFVYLDAVQYPRGQSFAARNRIKTPNGVVFLTVPVSVPKGRKGKASYLEVEFADARWRERHLKTIEQSYRRAPHFEEVYALYRPEVESRETLVELNVGLIEAFSVFLGIETRRVRLSQTLESFGERTQLIVDVCRALDAEVYLSGGGGGREYNDEALLEAHGIALRYDEFAYPEYPQLWGAFEPNLSIVDLLFNCGPASREHVVA
ncbi:MAG: WbqC family protein [Thermoleophilia bacterium]|nr:WbqC family protein [Thermoleophilia bacterium]